MGRLYTDTPFVIYFGESSSQPIGDDPNLCMALNLTYNFVRYSYKDLGANITSPWPSLFWSFCCLFRSHFCPFSWVKSRFQDAGCPTGGPDLSLLGRTCRGSRSHRKTHWCKGRLTADTLKHRKNVARKKTHGFLYIFPKINPWTKSRQDVLNWRFGRMGWNRATNYRGSCTISETANACIWSQGNHQCGTSKHALEDDKNRNSGFTH